MAGGESGSGGNRGKIRDIAVFVGGGDDAIGERLDGQSTGGLEVFGGESGGGKLGGELGKSEALGSEKTLARLKAGSADEVVRGGARWGEDESLRVGGEEAEGVGVEMRRGVSVDQAAHCRQVSTAKVSGNGTRIESHKSLFSVGRLRTS